MELNEDDILVNLFEDVQEVQDYESIPVNQFSKSVSASSVECFCSSSNEKKFVRKKQKSAGRMIKHKPNYFYAIQVKHLQIRSQASIVQNHITGKDARLSSALVKPASFHITLGVVHLKNQDEIERAKNALHKVLSGFHSEFVNTPLHIGFQGIGTFRGQVVFAKLRDEINTVGRLKPVVEKLLFAAEEEGVVVADKREWKPHLTLLKLSKNPRLLKTVKKIDPALFEELEHIEFGNELFESVQLCSMDEPKDADGYYPKLAEYRFNQQITTTTIPEPSNLLQQKLNAIVETTSVIKRRIHSLMLPQEGED